MNAPICLNCRQHKEVFITKLERFSAVVLDEEISFYEPRAYCEECGDEIWVAEYDEIHIDNYCMQLEKIKEKKDE